MAQTSERNGKRSIDDVEEGAQNDNDDASSSSDDDDFGPALPSAATAQQDQQQQHPKKKRRKLPYEKLYIAALPTSTRYSRSLMHREQLFDVTFTPLTDFLVTTSVDGVVKFWKKVGNSGSSSSGGAGNNGAVEFVKEFKAHTGAVTATSVSADGRSFASASGEDGTIKVFDVVTFDLVAVISLAEGERPRCICWIHRRGASLPLLAVSLEGSGEIRVYDGRGVAETPVKVLQRLHRRTVVAMAFNNEYDCVVSADEGGMLEYWSPSSNYEKPGNVFEMKSTTNLFEFKKARSIPTTITMSPNGQRFVTYSFPDQKVRVFEFATGKLYRTYEESIQTVQDMQQAGTAAFVLEKLDFDRRLGVEKELSSSRSQSRVNVTFDESGHFIIYGSILGVKVINTLTNRLAKVYGKDENFRALHVALYQGAPDKKGVVTVAMAASDNPLLQEAETRDAMLVATGIGKVRFYMFTNDTDISKSSRDIQNEKPRNLAGRSEQEVKKSQTGHSAIIHTTLGDIHLKLFPELAPKAVENFVTHSRNGYYNNIIFHRVIKKFMIQTGDPLGDGTGGESIWGREFVDEFAASLRHDKPYALSMANAGPNTNGSQFFITTEATPWLDDKHTVFGRATQGFDVVHRIENARTYKEKPDEEIKMVSITIL